MKIMTATTYDIPDLTGKTALVTGASRGLGFVMAEHLARAGAHIIALARTQGGLEELDDTIRAAGGSASLIPADLSDMEAMEQLAPALANRFPVLDILVANAGVLGELAPLGDISPTIWQKTLDINVTANWNLIRQLDPMLRAAPHGRAVFVTSRVGGEIARPFWGAYAVSKAGLEMLARTYAAETRQTNVRTAILDPGAMPTKMRATAMPGEDPSTLPDPEELMPVLYAAIADTYDGEAERFAFRAFKAKPA